MYSFTESVIEFFTPLRWSVGDDALVFSKNDDSGDAGLKYQVRSLGVVCLAALTYEFSPEILAGTESLMIASQVVAGIVAIGGIVAFGFACAAKPSS